MADKCIEQDATVKSGNLLQKTLENYKVTHPGLSTLAQKGDDELVEKFMSENVTFGGGKCDQEHSQLYIASFWGFYDVVKGLVDGGSDVNFQNSGSLWTPLHAAAFQEHGKIVMYLLENGADPNIKDSEGRSPADFASASDKVWAHFAASGCSRSSKQMLLKNRIIRKVSSPLHSTGPGRPDSPSGLKLSSFRPDSPLGKQSSTFSTNSQLEDSSEATDTTPVTSDNNGDVLANERSPLPDDRPDSGKRAGSALIAPWDR